MTSCCSPASWYMLAAAVRLMSLLMQELKPHSWVCVCLDIAPLPLFLIQQQDAQHRQHSRHQNCLRLLHRNKREESQTLPILHGSFLSSHPPHHPACISEVSKLGLHSSPPKTAVVTGFRGERWHKTTYLLALLLLSNFWLDWIQEGNTI